MRRKLLVALLSLLLFTGMIGCDFFNNVTTTTTTTASQTTSTTTTTTATTPTTSGSTTASELEIRLMSIYQLAVGAGAFTGTYEEWLETVRGPAGREVQMQIASGYIQWRYIGEATWQNLIALSALIGPAGANGQDGSEATFRVSGGKLQWQYVGDATWTDLIDLAVITGTDGEDGLEVALRVDAGFLQWQYVGAPTWTNLIDLATLVTQPTISINLDGYWVINGVVTTYLAVPQVIAQTVEVTFDVDGGTLPIGYAETMIVGKGDSMALPLPTKDGYDFLGWITGTGMFDITFTSYTPFTRNTTLYAVWEQNLTGVLAFLNSVDGMNFTGTKVLNATLDMNGTLYSFRESGMMQIMQMNGETYRHTHDFEEYQNDLGVWVRTKEGEGYSVYPTTEIGQITATPRINFYDNRWDMHVDMEPLRLETGFDLFIPELFVKRAGENKYDYPITENQLIMYGIPVGTDVVLESVECYLDLDTYQIVINLTGQTYNDTDTLHPVTAALLLSLTEIGSTIVTIPMEQAQVIARSQIVDAMNQRMDSPEYHAAIPDSIDDFQSMIDEMLIEIATLNRLIDLIDFSQSAKDMIFGFGFEVDQTALWKAQLISEMQGHVEWRCQTATSVSCQAMQNLLQQAMGEMMLITMPEIITELVDGFYSEIQSLYVDDPAKLELQKVKNRINNWILVYGQLLNPVFIDSETANEFYLISQVHLDRLWNATSQGEIDQIYAEYVQTILSKQFLFGNWQQVREFCLFQMDQLKAVANDLEIQGLALDPAIIDQLYFTARIQMLAFDNPIALIAASIGYYENFNGYLISFVRTAAIAQINQIYNQFATIVLPEYLDDLDQRRNETIAMILVDEEHWDITDQVNNYRWYAESLPAQNWQVEVEWVIFQLTTLYNQLLVDANPASANQMGIYYSMAINDINEIPPGFNDMLNETFQYWKVKLEETFVPIENIIELNKTRMYVSTYFVRMYYDAIMNFIDSGQTDMEDLRVLFEEKNQMILAAMSVLDVWQEYENGIVELIAYPSVPVDFASMQTYLTLNLDGYYQAQKQMYGYTNPDADAMFLAFLTNIEEATHVFEALADYYSGMIFIDHTLLVPMRQYYVSEIERIASTIRVQLTWENEQILNQKATETSQSINAEWVPHNIEASFSEFASFAESLIPVGLAQAIQDTLDYWNESVAEKLLTATPESQTSILAIRDQFIGVFEQTLTFEDLNHWVEIAYNALNAAYVVDPTYLVFESIRNHKLAFLNLLYQKTISALVSGQDLTGIVQWHANYTNAIQLAMNENELGVAMQNLLPDLMALGLVFQSDLQWLRGDFLSIINGFYSEGLMYLPAYSTEFESMMQSYRTNIETLANPIMMIMTGVSAMTIVPDALLRQCIDYYLIELGTIYEEYRLVIASEHLGTLENMYDYAINQVNKAMTPSQVVSITMEFQMNANGLPRDTFAETIQSMIGSWMYEFDEFYASATDASRVAMNDLKPWAINLLSSSADITELQNNYEIAYVELSALYVRDIERTLISRYRSLYIFLANDMVYDIMDRTLETELDHLLWPLYYDFVDSLQADETTEEMLTTFETWLEAVKLIGYTFLDPLDVIQLDLLADLQADYQNYLSMVTPDDPYIASLMTFWTDRINTCSNPYDAIANRFLGRSGILDAIYDEIASQAIAELAVQYAYWQTLVGSEEIPQLTEFYQYFLNRITMNPYWNDYDFVISEFNDQASSLVS